MLSRRSTLFIFGILLSIAVLSARFLSFVNAILYGIVIIYVMGGVIWLLPPWQSCCRSRNTHRKDSINANTEDPLIIAKTLRRPRLHYLDNIKSVLTAIVVLHHVTCSFVGTGWYYKIGYYRNSFQVFGLTFLSLNQSYFMSFFFFISGYFTPSSYDRKGVRGFLKDKFKRLGLPFLFYFYCLGPMLNLFIHKVALKHYDSNYWYAGDAGPPWFLVWLLIFNGAYVLIGGDNVKASQPTLCKLVFGYGLIIGILQGLIIYILPSGSFIFMPITIGSLPFDILFFAGGVIAKRNHWLEKQIPSNISRRSYIWTANIVVGIAIYMTLTYVYTPDSGLFPPDNKNTSLSLSLDDIQRLNHDKLKQASSSGELVTVLSVIGMSMFFGHVCMVISFSEYAFFQKHFNYSNKYTKFFSSSAYTVYLIHPWTTVLLTWSYVIILENIYNIEVVFPLSNSTKDHTTSATNLGHDGLVWLGWIYTGILNLLIVFPLAWCIRQLPGLNKIL